MQAIARLPRGLSGLQLTRRQRRYLLAGGAALAVGLAAYQLSRSDGPLAATRAYFRRLRAVLLHYLDALAVGADTLHRVLGDLQIYLASDAAEPPASLRQLARLLASHEASSAATAAVSATVRGVIGEQMTPGGEAVLLAALGAAGSCPPAVLTRSCATTTAVQMA